MRFLHRLPVAGAATGEYLDRVEFVLDGYLKAADAHERMGDLAGARERHCLITELKQLRQEMLLLAAAERYGSWTPRWAVTCWRGGRGHRGGRLS